MKSIRKVLDWMVLDWKLLLLIGGGITFSIYFHEWILLAIILGSILIVVGSIFILGMGLESGFRNRFPLDYLMHLTTEIDFFKEKGFQQIDYIDPGSEHPGVFMQNENFAHITIILNAPVHLFASIYTVDVCYIENPLVCIHYDAVTERETKLEKLKTLYERMTVLNNNDSSKLLTNQS